MARTAITIPDDLQRALARANRGELEMRVPEVTSAARLLYAAAHQLIYAVIGTASGVIAYQAFERGRNTLAWWLVAATVAAFIGVVLSMRTARRINR